MIDEIRTDVTEKILVPMLGPGGKLRDFKHFQVGDENLRGDLQPGGTWEYDNFTQLLPKGGRLEWKIRFVATVYSSSMLNVQQGAAEHLRLLCRPEGGELVGLIPALATMAITGYTSDSGQSFKISLQEATKSWAIKGKSHRHWSYATEVRVMFETWLNYGQILSPA